MSENYKAVCGQCLIAIDDSGDCNCTALFPASL